MKVLKFENDFKSFLEDRSWQINSWKENQNYFKIFKKYNLSKLICLWILLLFTL